MPLTSSRRSYRALNADYLEVPQESLANVIERCIVLVKTENTPGWEVIAGKNVAIDHARADLDGMGWG